MDKTKERRRGPSNGVIIFASLIILIGAISFISIIISFFQLRLELQLKDHAPNLFADFPNVTVNFTVFWLSTVISLAIMLCWIVSGIGILFLKEWARQSLLISMGVYFLNKAIDIFINVSIVNENSEQLPMTALVVGIGFVFLLTVSINYFFTHPKVIKQFNRKFKAYL
jgi:hypothetical protein